MNRVVCFAAILLAALAVGISDARATAPTITKLQSRVLPPDRVKTRVFAQIEDLFLSRANVSQHERQEREEMLERLTNVGAFAPHAARGNAEIRSALARAAEVLTFAPSMGASRHPKYPLRELSFVSRTYATDMPGLCLYYAVDVAFEEVGPNRGARTPTRANAVYVSQWYHFLRRPPAAVLPAVTPAERQATGRDCAALENTDAFFVARDEGEAVRSMFFLDAALRHIRHGNVALDNRCWVPDRARDECVTRLKQLSDEYPWQVDCPTIGQLCSIWLSSVDTRLEIKLHNPARNEIEAIALETFVIIGPHSRID